MKDPVFKLIALTLFLRFSVRQNIDTTLNEERAYSNLRIVSDFEYYLKK